MPQLIASVQGVEVKHVFLTKEQTTLGRSPHNDIVLDNMVVSGKHCQFELEGLADVYVRDLGSTNGTYVNNQIVKARTQLHDGDTLAIGPFRIRYLQASEQPSGFGATSSMQVEGEAALHAFFQVQTGTSTGLEVPIVKAVTTFGKPGVAVVSVAHRRGGYFVTHLTGPVKPLLNGEPLGDGAQLLEHMDVLELAGARMVFQLDE